jgi:hypothetical protein
MNVEQLVFDTRCRVSLDGARATGDSEVVARQFDAVLMSLGFKLSGRLLAELGTLDRGYVIDKAVEVLGWAREAVGAHRQHNAYFIDFPANVPEAEAFWAQLLTDAVHAATGGSRAEVRAALGPDGQFALDLLSLPGYGTYQHAYADLLEHHQAFEALLSDRLTVIHLGQGADAEGQALFRSLAGSRVPLSGDKLDQLRFLAHGYSPVGPLAMDIPVRENLAVINAQRVRLGFALQVTSLTDILRVAAELSGADVTLATAPKFKSLPRRVRYVLMAALHEVMTAHREQSADIPPRAEMWKRLGERLHPHEFGQFDRAQYVFAVARGETDVQSRLGQFEALMKLGKPGHAATRLAPGELWRSADRLLRASGPADLARLGAALGGTAPDVSARVLLGVRQHLLNRVAEGGPRLFPGRGGRAWVTQDKRSLLDPGLVRDVNGIIDFELKTRLGEGGTFVFDPAILGAALPLTGKNQSGGLGVWPRGSVSKLEPGDWLRFYFHWVEKGNRTDYDLSALFVDETFRTGSYLSYTQLRNGHGEHSGDLTSAPAPHGATEFINVRLDQVAKGYTVIPQLYLYNHGAYDSSGESFDALAENFFGYMTRSAEQKGLPFEPRTVRMKTVLTGEHVCVMPVVFYRGDDGAWYAKWLHLGLRAHMQSWGGGHRVEENRATTELLARHFMARKFLTVRYLYEAWSAENTVVLMDKAGKWREQATVPVTYVGVEEPEGLPEGLPEGSSVITLANLGDLIPA